MKVIIYTDGAARGNPDGPGGYGAILQYTDPKGQLHEKEVSAGYQKTTNNRMELMAVIAGLSELNRPCEVTVYSDSKYVVPSALTIEGSRLFYTSILGLDLAKAITDSTIGISVPATSLSQSSIRNRRVCLLGWVCSSSG
ncbi:MAG: hypothetical protein IJT05_06445 [Lachnospiraceae bacterium]|nr:hypothetical protein [Lachnospiraceae bacterium]